MTTELTHNDLDRRLDKLDEKMDDKFEKVSDDIGELKVLIAASIASHDQQLKSHGRELSAQGGRVGVLEQRQWQQLGAITLGTLSFVGTLALFILTLL